MDDKATLEAILEVLISYIYCFAPQGGLGGLMHLSISQASEMLEKGYALSDTFKTASKYGYQPVIIPDECHWLYRLYIKVRKIEYVVII